MAESVKEFVRMKCEQIIANDKTNYSYGESNRVGVEPEKGSTFKTPRELARELLKKIENG